MSSYAPSAVLILALAALAHADTGKPNLTGKWICDPSRSEDCQANKNLMVVIEEDGQKIHIKETRGPDPKDDVSDLTCGITGQECPMQDGKEKASVSVYYNGPVLVVWKTHGRKGDAIDKQLLSLSPAGDSLILQVTHIDPEGKAEKLVLSKHQ